MVLLTRPTSDVLAYEVLDRTDFQEVVDVAAKEAAQKVSTNLANEPIQVEGD